MPAWELHTGGYPGKAASAINMGQLVSRDVGDTQRSVVPIATNSIEPHGIALATAVNPGDAVPVINRIGDVVKVAAIASIGAGANVGVASTNGALGLVAGASGVLKWRIGQTVSAAGAAGEFFSLYISPQQLGGLS